MVLALAIGGYGELASSIGVLFEIVGAIILMKNGVANKDTLRSEAENIEKIANKRDRMIWIGGIIVVIGLLGQLGDSLIDLSGY